MYFNSNNSKKNMLCIYMGFEKCNLSMQGMNNDNKKETEILIIILQQLAAHFYSEALFNI